MTVLQAFDAEFSQYDWYSGSKGELGNLVLFTKRPLTNLERLFVPLKWFGVKVCIHV